MSFVYQPVRSDASESVFIKNTFITLSSETESSSRPSCVRASSAPPSTRSSGSRDAPDVRLPQTVIHSHSLGACACEQGDADEQCQTKRSPAGSDGAWSRTASTEAFEHSESGELLEGYSTSDEDDEYWPSRVASETTPLRAKLKSTARSFEPTPMVEMPIPIEPTIVVMPCVATAPVTVPFPPGARRSFAEIVAAGLQVLRSSENVQTAEVQETGTGWTLTCSMLPSRMQHFAEISDRVGKTLLEAAAKSENIYVVGYENAPFVEFLDRPGFSTQLALVQDEESACWDLLAGGYCRRGCACRWQHPTWQVTVDVNARSIVF